MKTSISIIMFGILLQIGCGNALECFQCAYVSDNNATTDACLKRNVTDISICDDSSACLQLSYQHPDTEEYVSFFLGCGSTQCNETNSDGVERVEYNSRYNNYTLRTTCCVGDYCNCNSSTCNNAVEEHLAAFEPEATTAPYETTAIEQTTETAIVNCFHCAHIQPAGELSPECIAHNTTDVVECGGNRCMKLSIQNTTDSSYVVYTLDCAAESKCGEEDGVAKETVNGETVETVTCYTGDYSNCKSDSCLEAIGVTTTTTSSMTTVTDEKAPTIDIGEIETTTDIIESDQETTEGTEPRTFPKETTKSDAEHTKAIYVTEAWTLSKETTKSDTEKTEAIYVTEAGNFSKETEAMITSEQEKTEPMYMTEAWTLPKEEEKTTESEQEKTEPLYKTEPWNIPPESTEPLYATELWTFPNEQNTTTSSTKSSTVRATLKAESVTTTTQTTTSSATGQHNSILFRIWITAMLGYSILF